MYNVEIYVVCLCIFRAEHCQQVQSNTFIGLYLWSTKINCVIRGSHVIKVHYNLLYNLLMTPHKSKDAKCLSSVGRSKIYLGTRILHSDVLL